MVEKEAIVSFASVKRRRFVERRDVLKTLGIALDSSTILEKTHFPDCSYCNVRSKGISLCFDGQCENKADRKGRQLACIHVFAETGKEKYKKDSESYREFTSTLSLPWGLRLSMKAKDVVELLGEPDLKTGGGRQKGNIAIVYCTKGLQVNMAGCDWAKSDDSIVSIDLFEPREAKPAEKKASEEKVPEDKNIDIQKGDPHTCDFCGRRAVGLNMCSKCKSCWFCDSQCLTEGWKKHKPLCEVHQKLDRFNEMTGGVGSSSFVDFGRSGVSSTS